MTLVHKCVNFFQASEIFILHEVLSCLTLPLEVNLDCCEGGGGANKIDVSRFGIHQSTTLKTCYGSY